jgi:hypothetical protein
MKRDKIIYARIPSKLRSAIERERLRMSRVLGAEVKTSAVIRAILEEKLTRRRRAA